MPAVSFLVYISEQNYAISFIIHFIIVHKNLFICIDKTTLGNAGIGDWNWNVRVRYAYIIFSRTVGTRTLYDVHVRNALWTDGSNGS